MMLARCDSAGKFSDWLLLMPLFSSFLNEVVAVEESSERKLLNLFVRRCSKLDDLLSEVLG